MCSQYWPIELNKPTEYGPIEVTLLTEETLAEFTIRTLKIRRLNSLVEKTKNVTISENGERTNGLSEEEEYRIVYQFHYHEWPIHSCPYPNSILQFRRRVRIYMNEISQERAMGPTIVHCSDGCGRTGAYLCIDANLELADEDNMYDVFGYTKKMRQARKGMIESV
ncbi:tyrosine phosphatase epsilon-like protein, partial [Dinothrombium tinctorium]